MKKQVTILIVLLSFIPGLLSAQDLTEKGKSIIHTSALQILQNYETTINRIGEFVVSDAERAKSEAEGLLELFVNRQVLIYNDLDPSHNLSEFYEAETYSTNIILWYPDGINISLDLSTARVSDIIDHGENVYSLDIFVLKTINGNYLNQSQNANRENLSFRIAFRANNRSYSNFRIVGIRNASSNFVINDNQALSEVNAEVFGEDDLIKIQSEIRGTLQDYTNYLALLGDPQEVNDDKEFYKTSFISLFDSTGTKVFNDINPEPESSLISVSNYLTNFQIDYPNGVNNISLNIDSSSIGNIIKINDGTFYTYVDAEKFFSGSFEGSEVFRNAVKLKFKISFNKAGKTFAGFRIAGIDITSVNFYERTDSDIINTQADYSIQPVTRKGIFISVYGSFGQTKIIDQDINNLTLEENYHTWGLIPDYGYNGGIDISLYLSNNFAFKTGIEYSQYLTKYNLDGTFQDATFSTDVNSDSYYKIIEADFDSIISVNFLTIPAHVSFISGKPGAFGIYVDGGLNLSIPISSNYNNMGNYKLSGYYPYNPEVLQYLDIEELGFYDKNNLDKNGEAQINTINISLYASAGISIPIGYYSAINIGPEVVFGISDIVGYKQEYSDIFGRNTGHLDAKIRSFGIKISFTYKL